MPVKYFSFDEVDKGTVTQLPSTKVAFTTGNNVRITPGYVSKTFGKSLLATNAGVLPIRAMFTFIGTDGAVRTIMCCDSAVYVYNSTFGSYEDITPASAPTGGSTDTWQFDLVSGLPVLSNGKDGIWKWVSYAGVLTALTGAPTWARRLSSCMNRLVVSDLKEGTPSAYTGRVRWSEPGNPENWTIDTTNKAGRHDIMSYQGGVEAHANIKAQITRAHEVFFFTERGLWKADFAAAMRNFVCVNPITEILSSRALCKKEETIYFIGKNDLFWTGGGDPTAFGLPIRDELFGNLNASYYHTAFCFAPFTTSEVWFCVAQTGYTTPNKAFIYNTETKSWTIHDADFSCHAEALHTAIPYDVVGNASGQILRLDSGYNTAAGLAIDGRIETGDMTFGAPDRMKRISDVIPELAVQDTVSELMIQVGLRNRLSDDIKWSDAVPFTIGVSEKTDFNGFRREGKYVRVRFYSDLLTSPWALSGYTIKYEEGGTR
jgi:hypothetical protein